MKEIPTGILYSGRDFFLGYRKRKGRLYGGRNVG